MSKSPDPLLLAVIGALDGKSDVPRCYITAALQNVGWYVKTLSEVRGVALHTALSGNFPKGEKVIADELGVEPEQLWPVRYRERSKMMRVS